MILSAKTRAFLFNFLAFGLIFITLRLIMNFLFPQLAYLFASFIAGVLSVFLSPRFAATQKEGREVVLMKWIFFKNIKEV